MSSNRNYNIKSAEENDDEPVADDQPTETTATGLKRKEASEPTEYDRRERTETIKEMRRKKKSKIGIAEYNLGKGLDCTSKKWYGEKTPRVEDCARYFLTKFMFNDEWRRTLIEYQTSRADASLFHPPCIAFMTVALYEDNKEIAECSIVAISRPKAAIFEPYKTPHDKALLKALSQCATSCYSNPAEKPYFLVSHCSAAYNRMLMNCHENEENKLPKKTCAEKFISSVLDKLYKEFGDKLKVTGLVTLCFYPYSYHPIRDERPLYAGIVEKPLYDTGYITLSNPENELPAYNINLLPACKECQSNKVVHFISWGLSQRFSNRGPRLPLLKGISTPSEDGGEGPVIQYFKKFLNPSHVRASTREQPPSRMQPLPPTSVSPSPVAHILFPSLQAYMNPSIFFKGRTEAMRNESANQGNDEEKRPALTQQAQGYQKR